MNMRIVVTTERVVEVDLMALPFVAWPAPAKSAAENLLASGRNRRAFYDQLPAMRKGWLVGKVEQYLEAVLDLTEL